MGKVSIIESGADVTITIDGNTGDIVAGGKGQTGSLVLRNGAGQNTINFNGGTADLVAGGGGQTGSLVLRNALDQNTINFDGGTADLLAGGSGQTGSLVLLNAGGKPTINFDGGTADLVAGGGGQAGSLTLRDANGKDTVRINAEFADMLIGGNGQEGSIFVYPKTATNIADLGQATIVLAGDTGDIILKNADCAEDFDVSESEEIEAGTIMVIGPGGTLLQGKEAYDKKVAGVISGGGDFRPGIVLDKKLSLHKRMPLAMVGKVYCKADAQYAPIEEGDLLTTSWTPGHAMKVIDPLKAFGAVIGKALRPLEAGQGLIPILIALQ